MKQLSAMYERAQAHRMPVMIHTGTSIFPGARNLYAQVVLNPRAEVWYAQALLFRRLGGADIQAAIDLARIGRHDLAAELLRQANAKLAFSGGVGPEYDDKLVHA